MRLRVTASERGRQSAGRAAPKTPAYWGGRREKDQHTQS
jgi:hypothetical protein